MKYTVIGLTICGLITALATYFFPLSLAWCVGLFLTLVGAGLVNGILAEWEDRQPGGFLNPETPKDKKEDV